MGFCAARPVAVSSDPKTGRIDNQTVRTVHEAGRFNFGPVFRIWHNSGGVSYYGPSVYMRGIVPVLLRKIRRTVKQGANTGVIILMLGSYAQFAQYMGFKSKSYVNTLKKQGRLVFVGNKIDFEKSKQKIAGSEDISRQNVFDKTAAKKATVATTSKRAPAEPTPPQECSTAKSQFDQARAAYQMYQANLKKIELDRAIKSLGSLDQIRAMGYEIGKIVKNRMVTFAIRAAPVVTLEADEKKNREYLMVEIEKVMEEIRDELEQLKVAGN